MSNANVLEMLEESLPDLSSSEVKVLKAVALSQREKNKNRAGMVKFFSSIFCLLDNEQQRRKQVVEKTALDYYDLEEPIIEWTNSPEIIKDPEEGEQEDDTNT